MLAEKLRAASLTQSLPLFVGGTAFSNASSQTPSCSLTSLTGGLASAPSEGDVVIACIAFKDSADKLITCTTAGYIKLADLYADDSNDTQLAVFYKVLTSADTTVAFDLGASVPSRFAVHVWRNADPYRPVCIARGATYGNTGVPNALSVTTPVDQNIVLAVGANAGSTTSSLSNLTVPSGMENFFQVTASTDSGIGIASYLQTTAGAYDPAAFGGGSTNIANSAAAVTLCVWPNQGIRPPEFVAATSTAPVTTSSITVNKPAGTQQGDLMIAVMSASVDATFTGATGWTEVADQGVSPSLRVAYRYAGASEGSSYSFTSSPSGASKSAAILTYRYAQYVKSSLEAADPTFFSWGFSDQPTTTDQPWTTSIFFSGRAVASANIRQVFEVGTTTTLTNRVQVSTASAPSIYVGDTISTPPTETITTVTNTGVRLGGDSATNTPFAAVSINIKPA